MTESPTHPDIRFPPPLLFLGGFLAAWLLDRRARMPLLGSGALQFRWETGYGFVAAGLILMFAGLTTFFRAGTTPLPHRPASRLVTSGPYRITRNPMYLGFTAVYLGGAVLINSLWPLLFLPVVLLLLTRAVIEREERYLATAFGAEYAAYCRRVRRWL